MTRKRDYENDVPVDDALVVLDLLCRRWGDNSLREIVRVFRREKELPFSRAGSSPASRSGATRT